MIRPVFIFALSGLLSACSILPKAEQVQVYALSAPTAQENTRLVGSAAPLRISRPQSNASIDSARILVIPKAGEVSNYHGARWASPLPSMFHDLLLESFRGDRHFTSVSTDDQYLNAEQELQTTLLAYQTEYQGETPVVTLRVDAQLIDTARQTIISSRRFEVRQPSEDPQTGAVIQTFDSANQQLIGQIKKWVLSHQKTLR